MLNVLNLLYVDLSIALSYMKLSGIRSINSQMNRKANYIINTTAII